MTGKRFLSLIKMLALSLALLGIILIIIRFGDKKNQGESDDKLYLYDFAMGTSISIEIYGNSDELDNIMHEINDKIKDIDTRLISWRETGSELEALNSSYKAGEKYTLSEELYDVLVQSLDICKKTEGALDITIRPLANLWNIEETTEDNFSVPSETDINKTLEKVGYEHLEPDTTAVTIDIDNMLVDFGAVGKGYALDAVRKIIQASDAKGAVIGVGGSILVYGSKPDGGSWKVGIRNPKGDVNDMIGYITVPAGGTQCISTSGDYEKYIERDGKKYHHILDRSTGRPAEGSMSSVTVICENGLVSDGLSTACFILGIEKSKPVLEYYDAAAVFVDKDNNITVVGDVSFTGK